MLRNVLNDKKGKLFVSLIIVYIFLKYRSREAELWKKKDQNNKKKKHTPKHTTLRHWALQHFSQLIKSAATLSTWDSAECETGRQESRSDPLGSISPPFPQPPEKSHTLKLEVERELKTAHRKDMRCGSVKLCCSDSLICLAYKFLRTESGHRRTFPPHRTGRIGPFFQEALDSGPPAA